MSESACANEPVSPHTISSGAAGFPTRISSCSLSCSSMRRSASGSFSASDSFSASACFFSSSVTTCISCDVAGASIAASVEPALSESSAFCNSSSPSSGLSGSPSSVSEKSISRSDSGNPLSSSSYNLSAKSVSDSTSSPSARSSSPDRSSGYISDPIAVSSSCVP